MITGLDEVTPVARRVAAALTQGGGGVEAADGDGDEEGLGEAVGGAAVSPLHAANAAVVRATATSFRVSLSSGPRECGALWSTGGWWLAGST